MITPENRSRLRPEERRKMDAMVACFVHRIGESFRAAVKGFQPGGYIGAGRHIVARSAPADTFPVPPEKLSTLDWCELQAWRRLGGRLQLVVENALRDAPDGAPAELISLQHDLVELRQAPFGGLPLTAIEHTFP
jgi:hypothetical protein